MQASLEFFLQAATGRKCNHLQTLPRILPRRRYAHYAHYAPRRRWLELGRPGPLAQNPGRLLPLRPGPIRLQAAVRAWLARALPAASAGRSTQLLDPRPSPPGPFGLGQLVLFHVDPERQPQEPRSDADRRGRFAAATRAPFRWRSADSSPESAPISR